MLLFYIFVKKEGSNPFSSNDRVKIFSSESREFFVKKQPHPPKEHWYAQLISQGRLRQNFLDFLREGPRLQKRKKHFEHLFLDSWTHLCSNIFFKNVSQSHKKCLNLCYKERLL